ncbi:hypothetical protein pdam_00000175 [Pocillopora damicornis]|uniref:Uncharacterized protein n=1 Tax=Pocillopora damicornis TaxID=46731 RepID=A0A3M6UXD5_POCDA|nr:hypothetical protein pdam_00000175 [Pocillopora damicornis]
MENQCFPKEARPDQPRETMQSQPIAKRRWQIVSPDLFNVKKTPDELASPNEKLNSRRTKTVIPVKSDIIRASVKKKQQNKRYYDTKTKPVHPLVVGDSIRAKIRPQSSPLWAQRSVVRRESDRSYMRKADG